MLISQFFGPTKKETTAEKKKKKEERSVCRLVCGVFAVVDTLWITSFFFFVQIPYDYDHYGLFPFTSFRLLWGIYLAFCVPYHYWKTRIAKPIKFPKSAPGHCSICVAPKPFLTSHCSSCSTCVYRRDHHCPWVGQCIGAHNQAHFFLFLFCVFQTTVLVLWTDYAFWIENVSLWTEKPFYFSRSLRKGHGISAALMLFLTGLLQILILLFLGTYISLVSDGVTFITKMFDEIVWHFRSNLSLRTNRKDIVMTAENSFTGKEAVEFLLVEVPRIVPGKNPTRANMQNLLEMMIEWKIIAEGFPKKIAKRRAFSEQRIYVFAKSLDELKKPKPKSRRSASFSGARRTATNTKSNSPVASTLHRPPKSRMSRRLSRSNGNINKAGIETNPGGKTAGIENPGFEDSKKEEVKCPPPQSQESKPPKILNRSLESICPDGNSVEYTEKREKVYDWLPFFKSRRNHAKATARRSVSLDRNHCVLEQERLAQKQVTTPPQEPNNTVFMHPKGPLPPPPARYQHRRMSVVQSNPLARGRMYESIMRRSSVIAPATVEIPSTVKDSHIWKTELLARLEILYDRPIPPDFAAKIDGYDVQWNMQELDAVDGIVKSRCQGVQPDYPSTIVQFMEYLGRYPFSASKKTELVHEHSVPRMFSTLVNRLEDLNAPLSLDECWLIISLLSKTEDFSQMLETGAGRRWSRVMMTPSMSASSIDEPGLLADGFAREIPMNSMRASKSRRRALSPYDNRFRLDIQGDWMGEQRAVAAVRLALWLREPGEVWDAVSESAAREDWRRHSFLLFFFFLFLTTTTTWHIAFFPPVFILLPFVFFSPSHRAPFRSVSFRSVPFRSVTHSLIHRLRSNAEPSACKQAQFPVIFSPISSFLPFFPRLCQPPAAHYWQCALLLLFGRRNKGKEAWKHKHEHEHEHERSSPNRKKIIITKISIFLNIFAHVRVRLPFGPIFVRPVRPFVRPSAVRPLRPRFVRFVRGRIGWSVSSGWSGSSVSSGSSGTL
uniref:DEP domain-containing protein n=1 Tax=Caenorhabditis japonica TaxID=281687 RepID=A0A8R1HGZ2_CAEJA